MSRVLVDVYNIQIYHSDFKVDNFIFLILIIRAIIKENPYGIPKFLEFNILISFQRNFEMIYTMCLFSNKNMGT